MTSTTSNPIPQTDIPSTPATQDTTWSLVATHDLLHTPGCALQIEEYRRANDQLLLARARVSEWSPSVLDTISDTWAAFRACTGALVYTCADGDDDERAAFITSLGFRFLQDADCTDGVVRRMYVSATA